MSHYSPNAVLENNAIALPDGYSVVNGKIFAANPVGNLIELSDQIITPIAKVHSIDATSDHGVLLLIDVHGEQREFIVNSKVVFSGIGKLLASLADTGVNISPSQPDAFKRFIQKAMSMPNLPTKYVIKRSGFIDEQLAFTIGETVLVGKSDTHSNEDYISVTPPAEGLTAHGSDDDYLNNVLGAIETKPQVFAICAALAAPLAQLVGLEGGGFHIYGASGCGKSTLLQGYASVMGLGSEPGDGSKESLILRWSSTSNSLEALSSERSGVGLAIDELGAFRAAKLSSVLYKFLSGKGQARLTSSLELAKQHSASVSILSSGELSVEEKLLLSKETVNAGILARLPSMLITAQDMALDGESMLETAERIESFKEACSSYGGSLGPRVIQALLDKYETREALNNDVRQQWQQTISELSDYASNSIQRRVIRRFSLVLLAGWMACEMELIPFSEDEITEAVTFMIERWLENIETSKTDVQRAIGRLEAYLRRNYHSIPESDSQKIKGPIDGYKHRDIYVLLLPETFHRICEDVTPTQVGDELKKMGVLKYDEGKQKYRASIQSTGKRQYFYAIHQSFIDNLLESELAELTESTSDELDLILEQETEEPEATAE
ncbi:MAG: putative DNA primase/helicase [Oleiphilaceae bacterium]|jgi:putative DNA primase/helicase